MNMLNSEELESTKEENQKRVMKMQKKKRDKPVFL